MKKIITILFIIMLFITIIQLRSTYALYRTKMEGDYQALVGIWSVKVNETDLSSGATDITLNLADGHLNLGDSAYIEEGYIAPGVEGYFDLLIDATETDVSVLYSVEIGENPKLTIGTDEFNEAEIIQIEITEVEEVFIKDAEIDSTTEHVNFIDDTTGIAYGVIPVGVNDAGYCGKLRVKFKWIDAEDGTLDGLHTMLANDSLATGFGYTTGVNEIDASLINTDVKPNIIVPIKLQLRQYLGGTLTP